MKLPLFIANQMWLADKIAWAPECRWVSRFIIAAVCASM